MGKVRKLRHDIFTGSYKKEINAIPDAMERIESLTLLQGLGIPVKAGGPKTRKRAEELFDAGFGAADAAHVAFAEQTCAEFISCDDALVRRCRVHNIKIWCGNPVAFCEKEGLK